MNHNQALMTKLVATATLSAASILSVPSVTSAHFNKENLTKGTTHESVKVLQLLLKDAGYYQLTKPTGYFGATTENAVKKFQADANLNPNGVVGPETKRALISEVLKRSPVLLSQGDEGQQVKEVQTHLEGKGYYNGHLDGVFGSLTRLAVLKFQHDHDLMIDGIVGPETQAALTVMEEVNHQDEEPQNDPTEKTKIPVKEVKKSSDGNKEKTAKTYHPQSVVKEIYMNSTAYTANCSGCSGITATGINLNKHPELKVVAVDPSVIPLGSRLYIEGYGYAVAGDTGGAIKGHRVDLFFPQQSKALDWGRRTVKVKVLDAGS
jgi:3D (Asp-Asp-Asp) domain-containing protein